MLFLSAAKNAVPAAHLRARIKSIKRLLAPRTVLVMLVHAKLKRAHGTVVKRTVFLGNVRIDALNRQAHGRKTKVFYLRVGVGAEQLKVAAAYAAHRLKTEIFACARFVKIYKTARMDRRARRVPARCEMLSPADIYAAGLFCFK